ncbi:carboxypeptidase-like regulatory domain-containing protein [Parafrigoribacterium soli]|uniref:carboxypeptidase-like regulatory domain-containing protein n=1 Tax=Parafrigoribacterium soli TaxID=3144663 RepID=UPI0032EEA348
MRSSITTSRFARAAALGLAAALVAGASLFSATTAQAVDARYSITGAVNAANGTPLADVAVSITFLDTTDTTNSRYETTSDATGAYAFAADQTFPDGDYTINFTLAGYGDTSVPVTVAGADVVAQTAVMSPNLAAGTVAITGTPLVGNALTATTAGWPAGTTFTYEWFYNCGECGGSIDGQTASSYTVTDNYIGDRIGVIVTGTKAGFADAKVTTLTDATVSAPQKPTAAGTTDLAGYLAAHGSTPAAQTSAGLPAGPLDPAANYTAKVNWSAADSYVDVYIYSTPTLVGTFPVVNGVAQVTLSKAVLATLSTGTHTLVLTGQSSGTVQSFVVALGLAATGAESPAVPLTVASLLLLLGAGLLITRRRMVAQQA